MMTIFMQRALPPYLLPVKASFHKRWSWYFGLGLALILLGIWAISTAIFTTLLSVIFFGFLLVTGALAMIFHATQFWQINWRDFSYYGLLGLLYAVVGLVILYKPMIGAATLTIILSMFYLFQGISRITIAFMHRLPGWEWMLTNGIISLLLGSFIWIYWPIVSYWLIGLFIGIDIIFMGVWLAMLGWSVRNATEG